MSWRLVAGVTAGWRLAPMTCSDRTVILKWTGPWWTPESSTPRYHQHSGDSRKSPGVGRLDPRVGERALLWLFCRRCAGLFKAPVIVALCPRSISSTEGLIAAADEWDQMASYDEVAR